MSNRSKRKGTDAEVVVRDYLRAGGFVHAERLPSEGAKDRGDIAGIDPRVVIEIKNCEHLDLGGWMREVAKETANAEADIGVVWHKRRGKATADEWYVTMTGETFLQLLYAFTGLELDDVRAVAS